MKIKRVVYEYDSIDEANKHAGKMLNMGYEQSQFTEHIETGKIEVSYIEIKTTE